MSVLETERTGTILEFYDADTGAIKEDGTNARFDFALLGAQGSFFVGDGVIFITLRTPGGRDIVKQVIKK